MTRGNDAHSQCPVHDRVRRLFALGACASTHDEHDARPDDRTVTQIWANPHIEPLGQPVSVGNSLVLYELRDEHLWLTALDSNTGKERWSVEATPSYTTPGVSLNPEVIESQKGPLVALLRRGVDDPMLGDLVLVDPDTGTVVQSAEGHYFTSFPEQCPDERAVCVSVADPKTGSASDMRLDVTTSAFTTVPVPDGWQTRSVGTHGLVENGLRGDGREAIARMSHGRPSWTLPLSSAFGAGATTDQGWSFVYDAPQDVFVGTVGVPFVGTLSNNHTDLDRFRTVGIDAMTGRVLWQHKGTSLFCGAFTDEDAPDPVYVRCRQTGTQNARIVSGRYDVSFEDLEAVLEGFDPRTGATTWSLPMGSSNTLYSTGSASRPLPRASSNAVVLQTPRGPRVVDLSTGRIRAPRDEDLFACSVDASYRYFEPAYAGDVKIVQHRAGALDFICDAEGRQVNGAFTKDLAQASGATSGREFYLSTRGSVVAMRLS